MDKIPFTTYDVFGYLASGLALLAGLQLAFGFPPVLNSELRTLDAVFLLLAAYVLGHVIAAASQFVLESIVIEKGLGRPIDNLFRSDKPPGIRGKLFPGYFKPLPLRIREEILISLTQHGVTDDPEERFIFVQYSPAIRSDAALQSRLTIFLNLYGFSRNLCFTALLLGILNLVSLFWSRDSRNLAYGLGCIFGLGIPLFYRYLKFFRHYSYELFNTFRQPLTASLGAEAPRPRAHAPGRVPERTQPSAPLDCGAPPG